MLTAQETGALGVLLLFGDLFFFVPLWGPSLLFCGGSAQDRESCGEQPLRLIDLLCLSACLSVANALGGVARTAFSMGSPEFQGHLLLLTILLNLLVLCVWWRALQFLRAHRLEEAGDRAMVHLLLYPGAVVSPAALLTGAVAMLLLLDLFTHALERNPGEVLAEPLFHAMLLLTAAGAGATYGVRRLFQRLTTPGRIQPAHRPTKHVQRPASSHKRVTMA